MGAADIVRRKERDYSIESGKDKGAGSRLLMKNPRKGQGGR